MYQLCSTRTVRNLDLKMYLDEENAPSHPLLGAKAEPVFVNVYGAQESIPRNRCQAGNRFLDR
jgi:hypothetical protein